MLLVTNVYQVDFHFVIIMLVRDLFMYTRCQKVRNSFSILMAKTSYLMSYYYIKIQFSGDYIIPSYHYNYWLIWITDIHLKLYLKS